jgi:fibronectin type 3 domain-containing protein
VTVSNGGGSNLNISSVSLSNTSAGFNDSGVSSGLILTPGQSATMTVTFDPSASGSVTGSIAIASNVASGNITLSGTGVTAPVSHSASLNWSLDSSATNGYNVYAGSTSGGPYTKVNPASVASTSYTDSSVQAGLTYYFVVTALDANNNESGYSNEVSALIP